MATQEKSLWERIAWKRVVPLAIMVFLILYLLISLIIGLFSGGSGDKPSEAESGYTLCGLNRSQSVELIRQEDRSNILEITDYNFYGESLNLYVNAYDRMTVDPLSGETLVLRDLCSGNETSVTLGSTADAQIDIGSLDPGFYSVYVKDGAKYHRVYVNKNILSDNTILSVTRDQSRHNVELIANAKVFDTASDETSLLDRSYLYLKVTSEPVRAEVYDVVISTAPSLTSSGVSLVGEEFSGTSEAAELWDVAQQLKTDLEAAGLTVKIVKSAADSSELFYGAGGTLSKIYSSRAKYFLFLDMTNYESDVRTWYSSFASDTLAASVAQQLTKIGLYSGEQGAAASIRDGSPLEGVAGEFDSDYEIRESGGLVLGAGVYSEAAAANASFAARNRCGVNAVRIVTTNVYDAASVSLWNEKKGQTAQAIADGVLAALGITAAGN
jgi:hypothetical protein